MDKLLFILALLAALGSGLIAGAFFIFSVAVMRSFERLPASEGIAAMQTINVVILNPVFLGVFAGTALISAAVAVLGLTRFSEPGSKFLIAGALLYIVGCFAVTMALNVPLNNALAAADPASPAGHDVWKNYLTDWTFWNHVRTIASLAGMAAFVIGLAK